MEKYIWKGLIFVWIFCRFIDASDYINIDMHCEAYHEYHRTMQLITLIGAGLLTLIAVNISIIFATMRV